MKDSETFSYKDQAYLSNIPLVFYKIPKTDMDTPPGSMRILETSRVIATLLATFVTNFSNEKLPMLQKP